MHSTVVPSFPFINENNRPLYDFRVKFPSRDSMGEIRKARPYVPGGTIRLGSATRPSFGNSR